MEDMQVKLTKTANVSLPCLAGLDKVLPKNQGGIFVSQHRLHAPATLTEWIDNYVRSQDSGPRKLPTHDYVVVEESIIENPDINDGAFRTYLMLLRYDWAIDVPAGHTKGYVFVSLNTLAQKRGVSIETIRNHRDQLKAAALITYETLETPWGTRTLYHICGTPAETFLVDESEVEKDKKASLPLETEMPGDPVSSGDGDQEYSTPGGQTNFTLNSIKENQDLNKQTNQTTSFGSVYPFSDELEQARQASEELTTAYQEVAATADAEKSPYGISQDWAEIIADVYTIVTHRSPTQNEWSRLLEFLSQYSCITVYEGLSRMLEQTRRRVIRRPLDYLQGILHNMLLEQSGCAG